MQEYAEKIFLSGIFFCTSGRKIYFQENIWTTLKWTLKSAHKGVAWIQMAPYCQ